MKGTIRINAFEVMKLQKQVRNAKGKQAALRHFEQLRRENRELQIAPVVTTIW